MTIYKIGTLNNEPELKENLFKEIKFLNREGIHVNISEKTVGKTLFINCSVADPDTEIQNAHEKILRFYLSNIITDLLMNEVTKSFIYRIIKHRYLESYEFGADEFGTILQSSYSFLNNLHEEGDIEKTLSRHNRIFTEVGHYLESNPQMDLEGFFRFRLKDYFQELIDSVEKAINNLQMEKEYLEFLRLLRYFVDVQEPKIDEVHVLFQNPQEFYILDESFQPIKPGQLEGIMAQLDQDIEYEDWVLSALITIAPRKIILHIISPVDVVDTIISVFQQRISICRGCQLCGEHPAWQQFKLPD
jgi:putative sporulation protein YtxC